MTDVSGQTFKYSGRKYTLQIMFRSVDGACSAPLDTNAVEQFEYETELNSFLVRGSVSYSDKYGLVDAFLEKPGTMCDVMFVENEQKLDGSVTIEKQSETRRFMATFLVESIGITGREGNVVFYKIDIVSDNVFKCETVIDYTNYSSGKASVFDIMKACITQAGLEPDQDSFDRVRTDVRINYITNGNDNVFSVAKYLMSRLYYCADADDSLKFFMWNESTGKVQLFDIKDKNTATGTYSIMLSLLKSKNETLVEQEPNNIGTITRMPFSSSMRSFYPVDVSSYDYDTNSFKKSRIESKQLVNYFNKTYQADDVCAKMYPMAKDSNYAVRGSQWNNDFRCYDNMVRSLTKNNALLVDTSGDILRKPGSVTYVAIDRKIDEAADDTREHMDDLMRRYRGLEGQWFAARVHNIVQPQKKRYRQILALCRNFTIDPENKNRS